LQLSGLVFDRSKFVEPVEPVEPPAGSGKKSDSGAAGCWFEVSSKNRTFPWQFYWKHDEALDFGVLAISGQIMTNPDSLLAESMDTQDIWQSLYLFDVGRCEVDSGNTEHQ
jgi:hypothetical protein